MMPEQPLAQLEGLSEDVRVFWEKKQEELGEGLIKFSYGILMSPKEASASEKCGVVYLMEENLWFEDFFKPPLFFQTNSSQFTKTQFKIPRMSIAGVEVLSQKEFEQRFFGQVPSSGLFQNILSIFRPKMSYLIITEAQANKEPTQYIFRDLGDLTHWLELLHPKES